MENYTKGEERELDDPYPFSQVEPALQMRITQGSKIRNVMGFAMKNMAPDTTRHIAWNGSGPSVTKAITCAEVMKRRMKNLHQITNIRFKRIEEHWIPQVDGLEPLKVNRDIPAISILLSKDPLDTSEPGYQPPGVFEGFWQDQKPRDNRAGRRRPRPGRKSGGQQEQKDREGAGPQRSKAKNTSSAKASTSAKDSPNAKVSASASNTQQDSKMDS